MDGEGVAHSEGFRAVLALTYTSSRGIIDSTGFPIKDARFSTLKYITDLLSDD